MMPMYQSEALWVNFDANYPFVVKVGAGKISAVTGQEWKPGLQREPQDYLVLPEQPWLDGFSVGKGVIRQFVAMPLGTGFSVEEQLTGKAEFGGIQLQIFPMRAEAYFQKKVKSELPRCLEDILVALVGEAMEGETSFGDFLHASCPSAKYSLCEDAMGLGAGGTMRQEIYEDPRDFTDWDATSSSRCFVHLCNSMAWRAITGSNPPHPPLTSKEYERSGIPWFDHYRDDLEALPGSKTLAGVKSVTEIAASQNASSVPDNTSLSPQTIIQYGNTRRPGEVRQGEE